MQLRRQVGKQAKQRGANAVFGYQQFFEHVAPYMEYMKNEYLNQRPPANVMDRVDEIAKK